MPSSAFVIILEDNSEQLKTTEALLRREGFTDFGTAGSIDELQTNLSFWSEKIPPDKPVIALIDNQAPWKKGQEPDPNGVGGIAERMIKTVIEGVNTVATTSDDRVDVGYGDFRYNPRNEEVALGKFVVSLPLKERSSHG